MIKQKVLLSISLLLSAHSVLAMQHFLETGGSTMESAKGVETRADADWCDMEQLLRSLVSRHNYVFANDTLSGVPGLEEMWKEFSVNAKNWTVTTPYIPSALRAQLMQLGIEEDTVLGFYSGPAGVATRAGAWMDRVLAIVTSNSSAASLYFGPRADKANLTNLTRMIPAKRRAWIQGMAVNPFAGPDAAFIAEVQNVTYLALNFTTVNFSDASTYLPSTYPMYTPSFVVPGTHSASELEEIGATLLQVPLDAVATSLEEKPLVPGQCFDSYALFESKVETSIMAKLNVTLLPDYTNQTLAVLLPSLYYQVLLLVVDFVLSVDSFYFYLWQMLMGLSSAADTGLKYQNVTPGNFSDQFVNDYPAALPCSPLFNKSWTESAVNSSLFNMRLGWEAVNFTSDNSTWEGTNYSVTPVNLTGWYLAPEEAKRGPCIVLLHGDESNANDLSVMVTATALRKAGFCVLAMNQRAHGNASIGPNGEVNAWSRGEVADVLGAVTFLKEYKDVPLCKIGLQSISGGGIPASMAFGLNTRICALAMDSAPWSLERAGSDQSAFLFGLAPSFAKLLIQNVWDGYMVGMHSIGYDPNFTQHTTITDKKPRKVWIASSESDSLVSKSGNSLMYAHFFDSKTYDVYDFYLDIPEYRAPTCDGKNESMGDHIDLFWADYENFTKNLSEFWSSAFSSCCGGGGGGGSGVSPSAFGDPHLKNVDGQRFDVLQSGEHELLVLPRGATRNNAKLHVVAKVDPRGLLCEGELYITGLTFAGEWLGKVGSLEFYTKTEEFNSKKVVDFRVAASRNLTMKEFIDRVPPPLAEVTSYLPEVPRQLNHHVTTLLVKLRLGPSIVKVTWEHQKEKVGFSNSLSFTASGLAGANVEIGGLLGKDDHTFAATIPKQCEKSRTMYNMHPSVFAVAWL